MAGTELDGTGPLSIGFQRQPRGLLRDDLFGGIRRDAAAEGGATPAARVIFSLAFVRRLEADPAQVLLYIDRLSVAESPDQTTQRMTAPSPFAIGARYDSGGPLQRPWEGNISAVRLMSRALFARELLSTHPTRWRGL